MRCLFLTNQQYDQGMNMLGNYMNTLRPLSPKIFSPNSPPFSSSSRNRGDQNSSERERKMIPQQWTPPCGNQCTHKYAALTQIPWRVFCKKGCNADGDTWEECVSACDEICYKDPVLKDQQWSAYIDRSPGSASYSQECFHACVSGCGYKLDIPSEKVSEVHPNRPTKPPPPPPLPAAKTDSSQSNSSRISDSMPSISA